MVLEMEVLETQTQEASGQVMVIPETKVVIMETTILKEMIIPETKVVTMETTILKEMETLEMKEMTMGKVETAEAK